MTIIKTKCLFLKLRLSAIHYVGSVVSTVHRLVLSLSSVK